MGRISVRMVVFDREADFALLEAIEHVAGGNRAQAGVVDLADGGSLLHINVEDPTLGGLVALEANVFEIAGVPQRVEIALQGGGVIDVADAGKNARLYGFDRNAAVAVDADADDQISLCGSGQRQQ